MTDTGTAPRGSTTLPITDFETVLTTTEAAERLGVAQSAVRVWLAKGRFPGAYRWGRDWAIPEGDVKNFRKLQRGPRPKHEAAKKRRAA